MPLYKDAYAQILDGSGAPYAGAKLYFYDEGTTTPKNTYTTRALSVANANPVVADADGRFPAIWLTTGRYKAVAKTSADVTIYTADGIEGVQMDVLTTRGDLLTRDASGYVRKAIGTAGQVLGSDGTDLAWSSPVALSAANVFTATQTVKSTDAGAAVGPLLVLDRDSASPAAADDIGALALQGNDDGAADQVYARFGALIDDPTAGSEDGTAYVEAMVAGSMVRTLKVGNGALIGAPTGGYKGAGTLNVAGIIYRNGDALPFSLSYASAAQTITAAGTLTLAHGLGVEPRVVTYKLQCTSAEHNFSVGNRINVAPAYQSAASSSFVAKVDATNVTIRFGAAAATFALLDGTSGASVNLTNASWQFYVEAYA